MAVGKSKYLVTLYLHDLTQPWFEGFGWLWKERITNVSLKININYLLFVGANTFDEFFNRNTFSLHFRIFRVIFGIKDLIIFVLQDILHHEIRWLLIAKRFPRLKNNKNGSLYLRFKVCSITYCNIIGRYVYKAGKISSSAWP